MVGLLENMLYDNIAYFLTLLPFISLIYTLIVVLYFFCVIIDSKRCTFDRIPLQILKCPEFFVTPLLSFKNPPSFGSEKKIPTEIKCWNCH